MQENTQKINRATEFVKSEGVEAKDIKTENYSMEPRYQYFNCNPVILRGSEGESVPRPCPPPEIVGYTITQTVLVKVRDFSKIGALLAGVVSAGANSVSQLSFTIDDPAGLESEARGKAIQQAREKAEAVARAGGFKLGRILSIHEGGGFPVYRALEAKGGDFGGEVVSLPAPAIEPGSQEIRVAVSITFEIR
jgi:uncharacterized protein YggE